MVKVDLMIIGAQKAGTTSLKNYLGEHPQILTHGQIEMSYFVNDVEYKAGHATGIEPYFSEAATIGKCIVGKNVAISLHEEAVARLVKHNPDCKIVFVMREPVSRAYSAYTMAVRDGWMHNDFSDLQDIIQTSDFGNVMYNHFVMHGFYARRLETVLKYVSIENLRVYLFEDLTTHADEICRDIFGWLGVDKDFHPNLSIRHNVTLQPKSRAVGKIIHGIRTPGNFLKRLAKKVLPYSVFSQFGNIMLKANSSNDIFQPMAPAIYETLQRHFFEENVELADLLVNRTSGRCLRAFSSDHWLTPFIKSRASR